MDSDKGCTQFCKPGYTSYVCSCAQGWKISSSDKTKCVPMGMYVLLFSILWVCVRVCKLSQPEEFLIYVCDNIVIRRK